MVDYAFFLIYLVEFLLRVYTYGLKVLKSASPEDMLHASSKVLKL